MADGRSPTHLPAKWSAVVACRCGTELTGARLRDVMVQLKRAAEAHETARQALEGNADVQLAVNQLSSCLEVGSALGVRMYGTVGKCRI